MSKLTKLKSFIKETYVEAEKELTEAKSEMDSVRESDPDYVKNVAYHEARIEYRAAKTTLRVLKRVAAIIDDEE